MATITIPKSAAHHEDLSAIPRKEYETLRKLERSAEFVATAVQKRALVQAEKNLARGNTLSYHVLVQKLGFTH